MLRPASILGQARPLLLAMMMALAAPAALAADTHDAATGHAVVEPGPAGGPGV
jgi:hypothetical protein